MKDRISQDLKDAMRARDQKKVDALRLITSAIKQIEVDERIAVDDVRLLVILDKMTKQRHESISQFSAASRHDLIDQEQYELDVIKQYLPEPLSDAEVEQLVDQSIAELNAGKMADMGRVMAHLKPHVQGRADMSQVSALIKARLQ